MLKMNNVIQHYRTIKNINISIREENWFKCICNYNTIPKEFKNRKVIDFFYNDNEIGIDRKTLVINVEKIDWK